MIASPSRAMRLAFPRLPQSPHSFGMRPQPVAPGSRLRPYAGAITAAADPIIDRSVSAAAFFSPTGRAGRPGPVAAWPGARFIPCLRVALMRGAGSIFGRRA